ncbi:MAG: DUF1585 domain-containing protein [Myxococcota bacterium]
MDTTPPVISEEAPQRELSEERVDNPACAGCHIQIEPVAWGIERFDATGRYVEEDRFGNPLREDGTVVLESGKESFDSIGELGALMANSERVRKCMGRKAHQFALGRPLVPRERKADRCADEAVDEDYIEGEGTYRDLLLAVARAPSFRYVEGQP